MKKSMSIRKTSGEEIWRRDVLEYENQKAHQYL